MTQTDLATTPAALACTLTGAYLIEASAGTGKTWTLTGIILRLLIEKNHAPESIIATTFTNAAAREIEERISLRLQDFLRCCVWLKERLETVNLYTADRAERQMAFDQAVADGWTMLADPVNAHLLHWLLESHPRQIDVVIARIRLTLMSLNKLFVGTLDSLAQKWLTEFSAQVGHDDTRVMNSEPKATIYAIIHDALRAERTRLYHEMPLLYQLTTDKKFFDTEYMVDKLWNALQFFSAKIDVPDCPDVDGLAAQLLVLAGYDYSAFEAYADADFRSSQEIKKNKRPFKAFDRVIAIIEMLSVCDSPMDMIESCLALESDDIKLMGELSSIDREAFSKKGETFYEIYQNLPNVDKLTELGTTLQALQQTSDAYEGYLIAQLGETVRCLLAERLQTQGETTFIIETARLNDALAGRHGAALARHIRHLYPVMLIDEAQDMNGEQASIVKRIYLQNDDQSQGKVRWFLLFVGDPKQAIYRFRGGDVANFNHLKGEQVNSKLSLTVNHRSHPGLIDSLNAWYGQDTQDDSRPKPSELGRGIHYQPISAHKEATHRFTSTLIPKHRFAVLHLQYEQNKKHGMAMFVAAHIASLLNDEAASGKRDHLRPTDIAVLARTTAQLHEMATALERYGVPAVISRDASVFETAAAQDMYQLLLLVSEPDDERLGAYLMSPMVGKSWLETAVIIQDPIAKGKLMYQLKALHARWAEDGVNAMLNLALAACVLTGESVWERVAKTAGERYLTDLWQLSEVVGGSTLAMPLLIHWYKDLLSGKTRSEDARIVLPSSVGVTLMTIHKSKGLEFSVVYALDLGKPYNRSDTGLYAYFVDEPYADKAVGRYLSPDARHKDGEQAESRDEAKRVGYVALTRASEQLFLVAVDNPRDDKNVLETYLDYQKGKFGLPEALIDHVSLVVLDDALLDSKAYDPAQLHSPQTLRYQHGNSDVIYAKKRFFSTKKTSFSALLRRIEHHSPDLLGIPKHDVPDGSGFDEYAHTEDTLTTWLGDDQYVQSIQARFVRGVNAGLFLHRVLQRMVLQSLCIIRDRPDTHPDTHLGVRKDSQALSALIDHEIMLYDLPRAYLSVDDVVQVYADSTPQHNLHQELKAWLIDIVNTPMAASGAYLSQIDHTQMMPEMRFVMGLGAGFDVHAITQAFASHSDKTLGKFDNQKQVYEYLSGEIDLVYAHDGRYYVVDYKSNHLGDTVSAYDIEGMSSEMDKHNYWLQAAIYQVALHRLLSLRIADYRGNEAVYLGAVEYYFVRGVGAHGDSRLGHLTWDVPLALILALDEIFAKQP